MRTPDENKIDRQFREGLNDSEGKITFREEDWAAMEKLLDKKKAEKKNSRIWLYLISGSAAAVLLLFLAWPAFKPEVSEKQNVGKVAKSDKSSAGLERGKSDSSKAPERDVIRGNDDPNLVRADHDSAQVAASGSSPSQKSPSGERVKSVQYDFVSPEAALASEESIKDTTILNNLANKGEEAPDATVSNSSGSLAQSEPAENKQSEAGDIKEVKERRRWAPRISLAILTAPDLNGVNSFAESRIGTNAGLVLSLQLTNKLSLSTGAVYAVKPYHISTNQYGGGGYSYGDRQTDNVDATCKVLDVPININYLFFKKGKNEISASTGLSSYFMVREQYRFNYSDNTSWSYNIANENKHLLGVLNLSASYQRQMNNKFNLLIQPYFKLPLTRIGNERIDLRSVGIAFGVGWNFIGPQKK